MQKVLRAVRIRFLRRLHGSSISELTALDVMPEAHPEIQEQYADLLGCVWECERRARQDARLE